MFKKKEETQEQPIIPKEDEVQKKKITTGKVYEYSIEIYDVWDTTSKRITPFGANRIVEGNTSYLFNEQKGFKEPFPENTAEYKEFEEEQIKEKITALEKQIKDLEKNNKSIESKRDIQKQLRIFRGYERSHKFKGSGSFMILNSEGIPTFQFDRIGNVKLPLYKNVDRSSLYIPSELKTKNVTRIIKENDEKNGQEQIIKLSTYALILLLILGVCFMFYMGYKMQQLPIDVSETLLIVAENMQGIGKSLNSLESSLLINDTLEVVPNVNPVR